MTILNVHKPVVPSVSKKIVSTTSGMSFLSISTKGETIGMICEFKSPNVNTQNGKGLWDYSTALS